MTPGPEVLDWSPFLGASSRAIASPRETPASAGFLFEP